MRDRKLPEPPPVRVIRNGLVEQPPNVDEYLNRFKDYDPEKVSISFNGQEFKGYSESVEIKSPKRVLDFSVTIKGIGEIKGDLHVDEENYNRYMDYLKTKDVEV